MSRKRAVLDMGKSLCTCGHTGDGAQSCHGGLIGHGPCGVPSCGCVKFSWRSWAPWFEKRTEAEQRRIAREQQARALLKALGEAS